VRTVKIDDEVWETLKSAAVPFEDEPNDALRRLLGLTDTRMPPNAQGANGGGGPPRTGSARFDRARIEEAIVQIIKEHGGQIAVKDPISGFNVYQEVGRRIGVDRELQTRLTPTGENAWRAEVGFARKNLEQRGVIAPTSESGRGVWKLK
jgi:hypothetical protein